jgi:PAS domain S-box-containing protein
MVEAVLNGAGFQQTPIFVMKQDGKPVSVVIDAKPLQYRGETFVLGVTRDLTGPEPTQRLSSGFDSIDILIAFRDPDGRVIWCNQAFADLCGCSKTEVVGTAASPLGGFERGKTEIMAQLAAGKSIKTDEVLDDGRTLRVNAYPIMNPDGSLFATVSFSSDITERKRAEARMVQSERMAAVGQVAAGVAHNLNNVLGAISANAELLALSDDPAVAGVAEEVLVAVAHGSTMIRNLYELAGRRQSPVMAPVAVTALVRSVVQLMDAQIRQRGVAVTVEAAEQVVCLADASQLRQVLMNLVLNSLQAMPRGGYLQITAGVTAAGTVALSVVDNGCGIPPEHMERLFEPFFTTKGAVNGTGLGLSTSRAMLRAMGGDIQVRSVPGEGTTVTVQLPVPA